MRPYVLSCLMEGYRKQQESENIRTAQLAIMIGAVNRSYQGKRPRPITKVSQLIRIDAPARRAGTSFDRIKTVEQYDTVMAALKKKIGRK